VSISVYPNNILQGAKRISEEITTTYGNSSNTVVTKTYGYSNPNHLYPTQITTKNSQGDSIQSMMRYPGDMDAALAGMNIQYPVLEKTDWENGSLSQGHRTSYEYFPGRDRPRLYLPGEESEWNRTTSRFENKYIYDSYDFNANILQGHKANDDTSAVIWDYSTHLPVIIADNVTNAILQSAVLSSLPSGYSTLLQLLTAVDGIATNSRQQDLWNTFCRNMINNSVLSGSMLSLYTYKPYIGMTSSTDSKGTATYYEYDSFNRLKNVKNAQGQLLKRDLYHYSRNQ
jgi:YD repeat-containing protein